MTMAVWNGAGRAARHVGRRGAFLLFLTLLDFILGYAITQPLPLGLDPDEFYKPFVTIMPLSYWAAWWIAVALLTLVAAFWHPARPVTFGLAALLKTGWALGYFIGWQQDLPAFVRGYQSAGIFIAFAMITLIIAGWRENGQ